MGVSPMSSPPGMGETPMLRRAIPNRLDDSTHRNQNRALVFFMMMTKFHNNLKTAVLLGLMTALILVIGSFFGQQGLIVACVFAALSNFVAYFFSDKIALMTMRAQEVGPEHQLYQIVAPLAQRA